MSEKKVLFTPALSGRETEFNINLFLNTENNVIKKTELFKKVIFENGTNCFLSELEIGKEFFSKKILLGVLEDKEADKKLVERFANIDINNHSVNSMFMLLGDENPLTVFPQLYCSKLQKFLPVKNEESGKTLSEIVIFLRENSGQGYFCSECAYFSDCFNTSATTQSLSFFNKKTANIFFIADYQINILEEAQINSCASQDEFNLYVQTLEEEKSLRAGFIKNQKPIVFEQKDISRVVTSKLNLFLTVIKYLKSYFLNGLFPKKYIQYDNLYLGKSDNGSDFQLAYLPVVEKYSLQRLKKLKLLQDATARIVNENNHYLVEFRKPLSDDSYISKSDNIFLFLNLNNGKQVRISCCVKVVENEYYLLEIENKNILFTNDCLLPEFMQDMHKPVCYFLEKNEPTIRDELFLLLFNILLKNSILGEDELLHAKQLLFSQLKNAGESISSNDLAELINTSSALAIVFRQENIFFKPTTKVTNKLSNFHWLGIVLWMVNFSNKINAACEKTDLNILTLYLNESEKELEQLLLEITTCFNSHSMSEKDEKSILKNALQDMVYDVDWLSKVLEVEKHQKPIGEHRSFVNLDETFSSTQVKISSEDKNEFTILMPKKYDK